MTIPLVSIVILTKNGGSIFKDCIKMVYSQKIDFCFEVIIIDSGSSDDTLDFLSGYPVEIFKITPESFSFGPTRDFGFSKARGQYIVTLSQDVVPANEYWLKNLVIPLLNNVTDVVQGHCFSPTDKPVFYWEREGMFYFTSEGKDFCNQYGHIGLSCTNLAIKRNVWEKVRLGNISMNEDKQLQKNLFMGDFKMLSIKTASCYHGHTYNLFSLVKRCENEGIGWRLCGVKYSAKQMLKDLIQERWVYGKLIRAILKRQITSIEETLFLIIRPLFIYKGNRLNKEFKF